MALKPGSMTPSFNLPAANRQGRLGPRDYKQRRNLVLIFFHADHCQACRELLRGLPREPRPGGRGIGHLSSRG
jgi:peroxiredoxin